MSSELSLKLLIWPDRELDDLAGQLAIEGAPVDVTVERVDRAVCVQRLKAGLADIALIPSVTVLTDPGAYDIYPAVAISSWRSATARIILRGGFEKPAQSLVCDLKYLQEALMARIVLREHYGMEPEQLPVDAADHAHLMAANTDAVLLAGDPPEEEPEQGITLDLGREWFEFTNYPMVWGLFVARKSEADHRVVRLLRSAVTNLETDESVEPELEDLIDESTLRYRLDDIATASLTELADLLFYYQVAEEVPAVIFASDPDAPGDGTDEDDERELEI